MMPHKSPLPVPIFVLAFDFCVELRPCDAVSTLTRLPSAVDVVVAKFGSSPRAAASSFNVSSGLVLSPLS